LGAWGLPRGRCHHCHSLPRCQQKRHASASLRNPEDAMLDALDWEERWGGDWRGRGSGQRCGLGEEEARFLRPGSHGLPLLLNSPEKPRDKVVNGSQNQSLRHGGKHRLHTVCTVLAGRVCFLLGGIRHMNSDLIFGTKRNAELAC
jgi:hypothetical protein